SSRTTRERKKAPPAVELTGPGLSRPAPGCEFGTARRRHGRATRPSRGRSSVLSQLVPLPGQKEPLSPGTRPRGVWREALHRGWELRGEALGARSVGEPASD